MFFLVWVVRGSPARFVFLRRVSQNLGKYVLQCECVCVCVCVMCVAAGELRHFTSSV